MPVTGLDERLAVMRAELVKQGVVNHRQADGSAWALTVPQAAQELGLTVTQVRRLLKLGLLRACQLDQPYIAMSRIRAFQRGRR